MKPGSIALISVNLLLAVLVPDAAASQGEGGGLLFLVLLPVLPVWLAGRWVAGRTKAADIYRVWYGTNRRPAGSGFSSLVDDAIHYGFCDVKIPKGHKFGSIGSSRFRRWLQRLMTSTDDALAIADRRPLSRNAFLEAITLRLRQEKRPSALVYIHGYNVSFETAGVRAAQIGFDLKVPGVTAFFSWPSKGEVDSYLADSDSIEASELQIADFLTDVHEAAAGATIHLVAHSMGNRGLLRALTGASALATERGVRFGQIFLAAPDIDVTLFRRLAHVYPSVSDRTTLYVSARDAALHVSMYLHENQRTGYVPPVTIIDGIDTIEVTSADLGFLGHGYYAEAAGVLHDMALLLRLDQDPERRPALDRCETESGEPYWALRANNT